MGSMWFFRELGQGIRGSSNIGKISAEGKVVTELIREVDFPRRMGAFPGARIPRDRHNEI